MKTNPRIKTPITYYGGKQRMLRHILPRIPSHALYAEPFCGGAAVFFAKPPSLFEVLNDTNNEVVNFYTVLQRQFPALRKEIASTPHSRQVHANARVIYSTPHLFSPVQRAWAFWILSSQSYGGTLKGGWKYTKQYRNAVSTALATKRQFKQQLLGRIGGVQLECDNALKVITRYNGLTSFFYCDPPYFNADCGHYKGYTAADFEQLLITLAGIMGKFLLSAYPSDILTDAINKFGWHSVSFSSTISFSNSAGKRRTKTEMLVANYPL